MIVNFDAFIKKIRHRQRMGIEHYYYQTYKIQSCKEYIFMKKTLTNGISKK
jgi:hypothetical protein